MSHIVRAAWSVCFIISCVVPTTACEGAGGAAASSAPSAIVSTSAGPTLPPMGVYSSCEVDTALSTCESNDSAMVAEGFSWEINYLGLAAKATGPLSLQAWFAYDASIGLGQVLNVKNATLDPVNPLTGHALITGLDGSLSATCPGNPTTNAGIIQCVSNIANAVPGFKYEWYLYDEPGCPNQSIGYCVGTQASANYANVQTIAQYIESIDPTHAVRGVNTPGGCPGGCGAGDNAANEVTAINNLFSWLTNATTPNTGYDYYPIPEDVINNDIGDIGYIAGDVANEIAATDPAETATFTAQAFSWLQEGRTGCTSISVCPFPTETQMQEMRDEALYYASAAGHPINRIYWYYWPDINCTNTYPGCNSSANLAAVRRAITAPFPVTPPPLDL